MCMPQHMAQNDCSCHCGCGEFLTLEEEIQRMEIQKQHLQFHLAMLERRIESMKKVRK